MIRLNSERRDHTVEVNYWTGQMLLSSATWEELVYVANRRHEFFHNDCCETISVLFGYNVSYHPYYSAEGMNTRAVILV